MAQRDSSHTPEARFAEMEKHRQELQTWAEENGLDLNELRSLGIGFGRGPGRGGFGGHGGPRGGGFGRDAGFSDGSGFGQGGSYNAPSGGVIAQ